MTYYLHSIIPIDIHKLVDDTYAIEMLADVITKETNKFIFLIFLIKFDTSIEKESLYINNIRKNEDKTSIYNKLISGKNDLNTFFLDWKFELNETTGFYYTDLASNSHRDLISDRLMVNKNMFLQTCIFLSALNDKENPKVCLNVLSDEEYSNIKKSDPNSDITSNAYTFIYKNTLYVIFKSDCVRYIEINRKETKNDG